MIRGPSSQFQMTSRRDARMRMSDRVANKMIMISVCVSFYKFWGHLCAPLHTPSTLRNPDWNEY